MSARQRLWLCMCVCGALLAAGARGDYAVDYHATPPHMQHIDYLPEVASVEGAGVHRGARWYSYDSDDAVSDSDLESVTGSKSTISLKSHSDDHVSSDASSFETTEKKMAARVYRECTPCPLDMIRKHTNIGIKWICGAYQRARRSFKSDCMMRYRNCQDGTMFVKVAQRRCSADPYHGRHWFYVYKV